MDRGWHYRLLSAAGTIFFTTIAIFVANLQPVQNVFSLLPYFGTIAPQVLDSRDLSLAIVTAVVVMFGAMWPLFKPHSQRMLDTILLAQKRIFIGMITLAALGYFNYTYRLPRSMLILATVLLFAVLPVWFVMLRQRVTNRPEQAVIVGDDIEQISQIATDTSIPLAGYLCPPSTLMNARPDDKTNPPVYPNGGEPVSDLDRLGGLSKLEDVFAEYQVDTVICAFGAADRGEFFSILDTCHQNGVTTKTQSAYANDVLTSEKSDNGIVDIDIAPWDPQDYIFKRLFDIAVSGTALLVLSPVILLIILALKIEGKGPVFFSQERTYLFGETFTIRKFRTLVPTDGGEVGTEIEDNRRTTLGQILRTTHLDEIPQLWSILVGDMSVVGPRPAQTELEDQFQAEAIEWRKRWFVKPGLTGLAQINNATSSEPAEKIQYDLEYIRNQSLTLDLKILLRQFWMVITDTIGLLQGNESAKK